MFRSIRSIVTKIFFFAKKWKEQNRNPHRYTALMWTHLCPEPIRLDHDGTMTSRTLVELGVREALPPASCNGKMFVSFRDEMPTFCVVDVNYGQVDRLGVTCDAAQRKQPVRTDDELEIGSRRAEDGH